MKIKDSHSVIHKLFVNSITALVAQNRSFSKKIKTKNLNQQTLITSSAMFLIRIDFMNLTAYSQVPFFWVSSKNLRNGFKLLKNKFKIKY